MTTSARVRWLDGTIKQVELEGTGASIASLRVAVAALSGLAAVPPPTRKSCKLYLRGVELRDDSAPLRISPGETVACVVRAESKKDRSRRRSREAEGGEKAGVEETGARPARPPPPRPPRPPPPRPPRPPLARPPSPPPPAPEGGEPEEPAPPPSLRPCAPSPRPSGPCWQLTTSSRAGSFARRPTSSPRSRRRWLWLRLLLLFLLLLRGEEEEASMPQPPSSTERRSGPAPLSAPR